MGTKLSEVMHDIIWNYYSDDISLSQVHDAVEAIKTIEKNYRTWIGEQHPESRVWNEDHEAIGQDDDVVGELLWSGHNATYLVTFFGEDVKDKIPGWEGDPSIEDYRKIDPTM